MRSHRRSALCGVRRLLRRLSPRPHGGLQQQIPGGGGRRAQRRKDPQTQGAVMNHCADRWRPFSLNQLTYAYCDTAGHRRQGVEVSAASGHGVHLQLRGAALSFLCLVFNSLSLGCYYGGGQRCVDARAAAQSQTVLPLRGTVTVRGTDPCTSLYIS